MCILSVPRMNPTAFLMYLHYLKGSFPFVLLGPVCPLALMEFTLMILIHPRRHSCKSPKCLKVHVAMLCDSVLLVPHTCSFLSPPRMSSHHAWPGSVPFPYLLQVAFFNHKGDKGLQPWILEYAENFCFLNLFPITFNLACPSFLSSTERNVQNFKISYVLFYSIVVVLFLMLGFGNYMAL